MQIDHQQVGVRIRLRRRTKNHLNSMYFGVLAVGADVAGGFMAMHKAQQHQQKISLAFKAVEARFLKRPEGDVLFSCQDGELIDAMLHESKGEQTRVNRVVRIIATCPNISEDQVVAEFDLTLSVRVLS